MLGLGAKTRLVGKNGIKTTVLTVAAVATVAGVVVTGWLAWDRRDGPLYPQAESAPASLADEGGTTRMTLAGIAAIPDDFERNASLYEFIAEANRELVEQYLDAAADLPATPHRSDVVRVLYVRYAALDPGAADHVLDGARRHSWIAAVFRVWAQVDLAAALGRASSLDPRLRAVVAEAILELDLTVGEREEVAFWLDAADELAARRMAEGETYEDLWESAIEAERGRRVRIDALAVEWAREDPEGALDAIIALGSWPIHIEVVEQVLAEWLRGQPREAGKWLAGQPPSMWGHSLTIDSLSRLIEHDVPAALAAARAFPDADFDDLVRTGFAKALEQDFDAAAAWLKPAHGSSDAGLLQSYARQYGRRDPREALDWALYGEADEETRSSRVREVFRGIARTDLALARRLVDEVADPESRLEAALVVVGSGSRDDWSAEDSLRLARSFRSETHRARMTSAIFSRWTRTFDLTWLGDLGIKAYNDDRSYANAGVAGDAALALPSGIIRDAALASVIDNVVRRDHALAERLFAGLGSSRYRAWGAARLYTHFADTRTDVAKSRRFRSILEAECGS